jgi:hypothetical protein
VPETAYRFESCRGHCRWITPAEHLSAVVGPAEMLVGYRSGQTGQTVNLLAHAFVGSNPTPTMIGLIGTVGLIDTHGPRGVRRSRCRGVVGRAPDRDRTNAGA